MTSSIREKYLQAAYQLEHDDLLAHNAGNNPAGTERLTQRFQDLSALYNQAFQASLDGSEREEIKKVHAQVSFLFDPKDKQSATYLEMKQVHHLRIALEHKLEKKLVAEQFAKLTYPQMRTAFKLLNTTFGRPTGKTNTDGMIHIAKNPLNLLLPAKGVKDTPRIIDVLVQDPKEEKSEDLHQAIATRSNRNEKIDSEELLKFYEDALASYQGITLSGYLSYPNLTSTIDVDGMRWLFPLPEDVNNPDLLNKFKREDPFAHNLYADNLTRSFKHMLEAYHLELGLAHVHRREEWEEELARCWKINTTHHIHIARILKCLTTLGYTGVAISFLRVLEDIAKKEGKNAITPTTLEAWRKSCPCASQPTTASAPEKTFAKIDLKKLLLFYTDQDTNSNQQTRSALLKKDPTKISEEEIRWLFPLPDDVEDPTFYDKFFTSCNSRLLDTFKRMLNAYDLELKEGPHNVTVKRKQFDNTKFALYWQTPNALHFKHIERMLKCLISFGFAEAPWAFLRVLEIIVKNEGKGAITEETLNAWRLTATH